MGVSVTYPDIIMCMDFDYTYFEVSDGKVRKW